MSGTQTGKTFSANFDSQDRLLTYALSTEQVQEFSYNANGELIQASKGTEVTSFTPDSLGRLKSLTLPDARVINYLVDWEGRRIGKEVGSILQTRSIYESTYRLAAEVNLQSQGIKEYIFTTNVNSADYMKIGTTLYRIIKDHLGSPRLIVNTSNGQVLQKIDYNEWGHVIVDTNPGFQPFGYAGGLYDLDTKLVKFGARDYDASIGRWLSKDPIIFAGGDTNLYGYVMQDPINFIDPSGFLRKNKEDSIPNKIRTSMPTGHAQNAMQCLESCLGGNLLVTGGNESAGHSRNSKHYTNEACDIAGPNNGNPQTSNPVKTNMCARNCGFTNGQFETFPDNPGRDHYHFQTVPGNGVPSL